MGCEGLGDLLPLPHAPALGCPCPADCPLPTSSAAQQTLCCQTPDGAGTAALALLHAPWARGSLGGTSPASSTRQSPAPHCPTLLASANLLVGADDSPAEPVVAEQAEDQHLQQEVPGEQQRGQEALSPRQRG